MGASCANARGGHTPAALGGCTRGRRRGRRVASARKVLDERLLIAADGGVVVGGGRAEVIVVAERDDKLGVLASEAAGDGGFFGAAVAEVADHCEAHWGRVCGEGDERRQDEGDASHRRRSIVAIRVPRGEGFHHSAQRAYCGAGNVSGSPRART